MIIKLKCPNNICQYCYELTEEELLDNPQYHRTCPICQSKLAVVNLDEIVEQDLYQQAENYLKQWVQEIGWDNTLDLIQRNRNQACYKIYKEILLKKGFKLND